MTAFAALTDHRQDVVRQPMEVLVAERVADEEHVPCQQHCFRRSGARPRASTEARDRATAAELSDANSGWHVDDMTEAVPPEPSGPPVEGGSLGDRVRA